MAIVRTMKLSINITENVHLSVEALLALELLFEAWIAEL